MSLEEGAVALHQDDLSLRAAASEPRRLEAVALFHELLEKTDVAAYGQQLQERLRSRGVLYGDRMVCPFLRPSFVTREQMAVIRRAVHGVFGAMNRLAPRILESRELQDLLGVTREERALLEVDPGYPDFAVSSRLDSFLTGGSLSFVENNAESPAGMGYGDMMIQTFQESEVMGRFLQQRACHPLLSSERLLQGLLQAYRTWGGTEQPVIGVIDYEGLPTRHEFEILRQYFQSRGYQSLVADPRHLEYSQGYLRHQGQPIHLVYRRLLTNELLDRFDEARAVFDAYRDRRVCVVNSFRAKVLHKKALFVLLSDPVHQVHLTPEQQQAVRAHIPWTRRVVEGRTLGPEGEPVDLLPFLLERREELVLKPNDRYGGQGIHVGWERTDAAWRGHLQEAIGQDYLVQRRVAVPREHYPVWGEGRVTWGEYVVDLDPYVFESSTEGLLTRLAASSLCNVTAGGGVVPCFVLA